MFEMSTTLSAVVLESSANELQLLPESRKLPACP